MSAWTVYWLFQLDSINMSLSVISIGCLLGAIFCGLRWLFTYPEWNRGEGERNRKQAGHSLMWMLIVGAPFYLLSMMIPSTKSMAAIIVLPRIASAENLDTVGKDAGDIYKLAMSRLKDALGEQPKS